MIVTLQRDGSNLKRQALTREQMLNVTLGDLAQFVPELKPYLDDVLVRAADLYAHSESYCAFNLWRSMQQDIAGWFGFRSKLPELRFCKAYDAPLFYVWERLPLCRKRHFSHRNYRKAESRPIPLARPGCGEDGGHDNRCALHRNPDYSIGLSLSGSFDRPIQTAGN